ncbi:MAG: glycerate kinase [Clostridiales bacterium]|nr:glycerate kinase [Clostridiales bacterium]
MKIVGLSDSFKGSLSAKQICDLQTRVAPTLLGEEHTFTAFPVGDGGEGTAEALLFGEKKRKVSLSVTAKNGKKKTAPYFVSEGRAYINAADAVGISAENRKEDALLSFTTFGLGELLLSALSDEEVTEVVIALGGTGTVDGGAGLLTALGTRLLDAFGRPAGYLPTEISRVASVDLSPARARLQNKKLTVLCDTTAPLLGEQGAIPLFAGQKGASNGGKRYLTAALTTFASACVAAGATPYETPSSGAAGGLGFALLCCLGGEAQNGLSYLLQKKGYEEEILSADAVISGEGYLDDTSFTGKTISVIASLCEKHQKPLYLICGDSQPFLPLPPAVKGVYTLKSFAPPKNALAECLLNPKTYYEKAFTAALTDISSIK